MYYEEVDKPAHARTSYLNEELGQVDTILSDKTGTLTCNSMEFIKCTIAGTAYGYGVTEVERSMANRIGSPLAVDANHSLEHPSTGKIVYEAESPDEAAFVIAGRELGVLEFKSARKRMSVIVRDEEGKLLLLCKGADSVMFERLANNGRQYEEKTREHCNEYADAGLRTLILTYRELSEDEFQAFDSKLSAAKNSVTADREALIDEEAEARAGIKLWVLTGDKMETAINIGNGANYYHIGEPLRSKLWRKNGEKSEIAKALKESVLRQITEGKAQVAKIANEAFALIIDGKSLAYALEDGVKKLFLELANQI
ncbi:hypothetical protein SASPL_141429 [Salvia splendens]|uniref:Uncharacterized protein n=1 Tax=Salvia splendens TaxID=180675 RepID=A0A8X8ZCU8_SALSN|nr:hypothetical protein SASPL_141429 [Salvia splendens]